MLTDGLERLDGGAARRNARCSAAPPSEPDSTRAGLRRSGDDGNRLRLTGLPVCHRAEQMSQQGAHDALVQLSGTLRTLAVSLYKIANDIRLLSRGRCWSSPSWIIPENEPGSS